MVVRGRLQSAVAGNKNILCCDHLCFFSESGRQSSGDAFLRPDREVFVLKRIHQVYCREKIIVWVKNYGLRSAQ